MWSWYVCRQVGGWVGRHCFGEAAGGGISSILAFPPSASFLSSTAGRIASHRIASHPSLPSCVPSLPLLCSALLCPVNPPGVPSANV